MSRPDKELYRNKHKSDRRREKSSKVESYSTLSESTEHEYKIVCYKNTACAERRPVTREDIENGWIEEEKTFSSPREAFEYVLKTYMDYEDEYIKETYEDEDVETEEEKLEYLKDYFDNQDWSFGEPILVSIEGPGVSYNSGFSKEDLEEEVEDSEDDDYDEEYESVKITNTGKKLKTESVDWSYYDKFENIIDEYMPDEGEGDTLASQIVTAVNKLIYKWYNDGDIYDNTHYLSGWANDLSDYANWLYRYSDSSELKSILEEIYSAQSKDAYENILKRLADICFDSKYLENKMNQPAQGSIYECSGPFKFDEDDWDEDEDDWGAEEDY